MRPSVTLRDRCVDTRIVVSSKALVALRQSDLGAALDFLREAEGVTGPAAFPPELIGRLLSDYFDDARGARLPTLVEDWLRRDRQRLNGDSMPSPRRPLTVERGQRRLVVTRSNGHDWALLLREESVPADGSNLLSFREWQVLGLVEEGKSNAEIAAALRIAPSTVRTHLENIYAKLGVRSRTAALARARGLKQAETA